MTDQDYQEQLQGWEAAEVDLLKSDPEPYGLAYDPSWSARVHLQRTEQQLRRLGLEGPHRAQPRTWAVAVATGICIWLGIALLWFGCALITS